MDQSYPPAQNPPPQQPQYPVPPPQGQYPTPYNPQVPQPYATQPKTNGLCIASLVTALAPLVINWIPVVQWFGLLSSIAAIILGAIGMKKVKESNGAETGKGLAVAGIVIGAVDILLFIIVVVVIGLILGAFVRNFGSYTGF